jgi:hypothetical protein
VKRPGGSPGRSCRSFPASLLSSWWGYFCSSVFIDFLSLFCKFCATSQNFPRILYMSV